MPTPLSIFLLLANKHIFDFTLSFYSFYNKLGITLLYWNNRLSFRIILRMKEDKRLDYTHTFFNVYLRLYQNLINLSIKCSFWEFTPRRWFNCSNIAKIWAANWIIVLILRHSVAERATVLWWNLSKDHKKCFQNFSAY